VSDERLRLLGASPDPARAAEILRRLDEVRIVVRCGDDTGQGAAVATAVLGSISRRLFGDVQFESPPAMPPNWWDAPQVDAIPVVLRRTSSATPSRDLVITVGAKRVIPGDFAVGGGDYIAFVGRDPVPVMAHTHGLGVHLAACLAISQVLISALGDIGLGGVALDGGYGYDLLTHTVCEVSARPGRLNRIALAKARARSGFPLAFAGLGSVGSSAVALIATALAPAYADGPAAAMTITGIDHDVFDPGRNSFRSPAIRGTETGAKATEMAGRLGAAGFVTTRAVSTVGTWVQSQPSPGFPGLLISSVDTLAGRLEVADVLARETLSLGVSGLVMHAQRERLGRDTACPFCDYVDLAPPLTQAQAHAATSGLSLQRVLVLMQQGSRLTATDVATAIASGKVSPERRETLLGAPFSDLIRQAYAEAAIASTSGPTADGVIAIAAPHVSWFCGAVAAAEVVKQVDGLPLLDLRVDADLAGLPPGLVRRMPPDPTGRCVCRSGVRQRWYNRLHVPEGDERCR
jgi:hypothetical protein